MRPVDAARWALRRSRLAGAVVTMGLSSGCMSMGESPDGICELPYREKRERCNEEFVKCLGSRIQSIPSGTRGHSLCHVCQDFSIRNNGEWADALPDGRPCR
jgi:hypothetical protein